MLNGFICAGKERGTLTKPVPAPLFRKDFYIEKDVRCADLRICGLGLYRIYINGSDITKGEFAPYISNTDHLVYVDEYTLTEHLHPGQNILGVILGNGMQNALGGFTWELDTASFQSEPKLAFEMVVEYSDGSKIAICSDESVMTAQSPIEFNDFWCGEYYDARYAFDWLGNQALGEKSKWKPALPTETPIGEQRISKAIPIRVHEMRQPVRIIPVDDGFLYDFGINDAGTFVLTIQNSTPGQTVTLTLGEYWDGQILNNKNLLFVPQSLGQVDRYICRGEEEEVWSPMFVYHGYRYILVQGITAEQDTDTLLTYKVIHADLKERGQFHCSDPVLEQLHEITRRSLMCNFFFYPTDCPQREKHGWTDAGQWGEAVMMNWAPESSYVEWMANIRKAQNDLGMLPGIVPTGGWGMNLGGPYWDAVIVNLPWLIWKYRGDLDCFRENREAIRKHIRYLASIRDGNGLISYGIGDWCPAGKLEPRDFKAPIVVTDTAIAFDISTKAAAMFSEVGDMTGYSEAKELAEELRIAARNHLVDWDSLMVAGNCQTSQAVFLYYRIFDRDEWPVAAKVLVDIIKRNDGFMDIGIIGGRVLFRVLSEAGETALAYRMVTRPEFPSYGNWLVRGATTLWEDFQQREEDVYSRNHPMWADISCWMYQWIAGIQVNPDLHDCNEAVIRPGFESGVQHASAWHDTSDGSVGVNWCQTEQQRSITIAVTGKCTVWLSLNEPGWERIPISNSGVLCSNIPEVFETNGILYSLTVKNARIDA